MLARVGSERWRADGATSGRVLSLYPFGHDTNAAVSVDGEVLCLLSFREFAPKDASLWAWQLHSVMHAFSSITATSRFDLVVYTLAVSLTRMWSQVVMFKSIT